jgi:hypothetical protein
MILGSESHNVTLAVTLAVTLTALKLTPGRPRRARKTAINQQR